VDMLDHLNVAIGSGAASPDASSIMLREPQRSVPKTAFVKQVLDVAGPWSSIRWEDTTPLGLFDLWPGKATLWEMTCLLQADWYIVPQQRDTRYIEAAVLDHPGRRQLVMDNVRNVVDVQSIPFDRYDVIVTVDPILDIPKRPGTLLAYYIAEHGDPLYKDSLERPIGSYDLFLDHMLNASQTLENLPQAVSFPYLRDPEKMCAVFGDRDKEESVWIDWRTLEALGLKRHDDGLVDAAAAAIEKRLGIPVRCKSDHLGILFGISDPPKWGDGGGYLGKLARSKYYVSVGREHGAGQGLCDAASLGCICVGEVSKAFHRILCHPECLCEDMTEMLHRLRRIIESPKLQKDVLSWQDIQLREHFVDRPVSLLKDALNMKVRVSPVVSKVAANASDLPERIVRPVQFVSQHSRAAKDTAKVVMTSGALGHYNGGTKIYNTWVKMLRKNGTDAVIATLDGKYEPWLVHHQPVVGYADVSRYREEGHDIRIISSWLDTPGLEQLIAEGRFYYFDAELKWTLEFRDKLDDFLRRNKIAAIATHSRYMQSWYMANYGIKPTLINEWSDESVFYEDSGRRIAGRIGCMPDPSPEYTEAFAFLADRAAEYGRGAELVKISGDEQNVADLLRTADIFVGLNPGKHPFWGEGCPRTQQEALHCGCVLVAYDCLGNREYLYDNWTGLMVPSGDVDGLWEAVKSLLEDAETKERLRAGGKNIARGLFSERNKYKPVSSFLGLADDAKTKPGCGITHEELSSIFPRPFWLAAEEVPFLGRAAADARKTILEIGCAYGGSTTVFLLNKRDGVQLHSIDPFIADSKGGVQANMQDCRQSVAQALVKGGRSDALGDWHLVNGYSHDVVASWDNEIDMLFIDGSHHYEDVKRDFRQWSRFVAANGRILIHDSRKDNIADDPLDEKFSRGWAGPTRFVEELKASPDFELVDTCYSISVFARREVIIQKR